MSNTISCPCGITGARRFIAQHRTTCPEWIKSMTASMGAPTQSPLCGKCGFIHESNQPCPDIEETIPPFDPSAKPKQFGGSDVPSPFVPPPAPKMSEPPKHERDMATHKPKKRRNKSK